jgi:hypothetical protein
LTLIHQGITPKSDVNPIVVEPSCAAALRELRSQLEALPSFGPADAAPEVFSPLRRF